jgi:phosphoglycerate kinase
MAYTFLPPRASRRKSKYEADKQDLLGAARQGGRKLHLRGQRLRRGLGSQRPDLGATGPIKGDLLGLDIGPATIEAYGRVITGAKTIVWNGRWRL